MNYKLLWVVLATVAVIFFMIAVTNSHEAVKNGSIWEYPISCCSGYDCRPVSKGIEFTISKGSFNFINGETLTVNAKKVKRSLDEDYHWCTVGGTDKGNTICFFVPDMSY